MVQKQLHHGWDGMRGFAHEAELLHVISFCAVLLSAVQVCLMGFANPDSLMHNMHALCSFTLCSSVESGGKCIQYM